MAVYGYWSCLKDLRYQKQQIIALDSAGCSKIYGDNLSGISIKKDREQLFLCLNQLKENDLFILENLTHLGQNMVTILAQVSKLLQKGVYI